MQLNSFLCLQRVYVRYTLWYKRTLYAHNMSLMAIVWLSSTRKAKRAEEQIMILLDGTLCYRALLVLLDSPLLHHVIDLIIILKTVEWRGCRGFLWQKRRLCLKRVRLTVNFSTLPVGNESSCYKGNRL